MTSLNEKSKIQQRSKSKQKNNSAKASKPRKTTVGKRTAVDIQQQEKDITYMRIALQAAEEAYEQHEVPVGAVIVHKDKVIARAWNQRELLKDPTAHAEVLAITQAAAALESWRLEDCTLYVTLEPCAMCAGAIILARIERVVYGANDPKAGACGSVLNVLGCKKLNHVVTVERGVLAAECGGILSDFFQQRRETQKHLRKQKQEQSPASKN